MSNHPTVDQAIERLHGYTAQLRAKTKTLADTPTQQDYWDLRHTVRGIERFQLKLGAVMATIHPWPDEYTSAHLALTAAMQQANETIHDTTALFTDQAGNKASARTPRSEQPAGPGTFRARFNGTCHHCAGPIKQGEISRYAIGGKNLVHDTCPEPEHARG